MATAGFVYLMGVLDGCHKIGRSNDPYGRLKSMGVVLPIPLRVMHVIATANQSWLERTLHAAYAACRLGGEWFKLSPQDVEEIRFTHFANAPADLPERLVKFCPQPIIPRQPTPRYADDINGDTNCGLSNANESMTRGSFTASIQAAVNAALAEHGISELSRRTGLPPTTIRGAAAGKAPSGYTIARLELGLGLRPGKLFAHAAAAGPAGK